MRIFWYGMLWYVMVWFGLVWFGLVWFGLVWFGMVWYGFRGQFQIAAELGPAQSQLVVNFIVMIVITHSKSVRHNVVHSYKLQFPAINSGTQANIGQSKGISLISRL